MPAYIKANMEFNNDIAPAKSLAIPTLAKKKTAAFSLTPKPPTEIGSRVIAPIICPIGVPASGEAVTREQCDGCPILKSEPGCISWPKKENYT